MFIFIKTQQMNLLYSVKLALQVTQRRPRLLQDSRKTSDFPSNALAISQRAREPNTPL